MIVLIVAGAFIIGCGFGWVAAQIAEGMPPDE